MEDTYDAAEVRELLAVIAAALSPPEAVYPQGDHRRVLIEHRAARISGALAPIVAGAGSPRHAMHLRELLGQPLGYEPKPEGGQS